MCGGKKWIIRSGLTGSSRTGSGAPAAKGLKNSRGSFIFSPLTIVRIFSLPGWN
jgi:hypothetical protein